MRFRWPIILQGNDTPVSPSTRAKNLTVPLQRGREWSVVNIQFPEPDPPHFRAIQFFSCTSDVEWGSGVSCWV